MKYKVLLSLIVMACLSIYVRKKFYIYYSPAKENTLYRTIQHHDDTIRIAYIGDSWAFGHHDHSCVIAQLIEDSLHRPVSVESYGIGGLTSKEIYNALFEIDSLKHFMKKGYNYCFISAGINDTYKKMSTSYYQESMELIIDFLLANNIHPVIQEIPDYNIEKVYHKQKTSKKLIRQLSMMINNTPLDCKQQFRDALDELIKEKGYQDKISIVRYKSWNNDYANDLINLYIDDQMHLNERGYQLLDSVIAKEIIKSKLAI